MNVCGCPVHTTGQRENTRMNESKYSVNGTSQISGIGERSVVMCVVTPSMRLVGTAPRPTQRSLRQVVISSDKCGVGLGAGSVWGAGLPGCLGAFLMAVAWDVVGAGLGGASPAASNAGGGGASIGSRG